MLYLHLLLWPKYVSNYDDKVLCIPYNGIRVRNTYIFHDPKMWYYPLSSVDQISKSLKLYGIKVKQKLWRRESFGSSAICVNVLYWYNPNLSLDIFSEYLFNWIDRGFMWQQHNLTFLRIHENCLPLLHKWNNIRRIYVYTSSRKLTCLFQILILFYLIYTIRIRIYFQIFGINTYITMYVYRITYYFCVS